MSVGSVKKVGCGHLYHTHCLREVVERARSMEAARCPLCRSSVLDGRPPERPRQQQQQDGPNADGNAGNEHALFRFSTEGIFPGWIPIPAFSFEVVRRPAFETNDANNNNTNADTDSTQGEEAEGTQADPQEATPTPPGTQPRPSFWRRLFMLVGAIPLTPEEEQVALEQLVDMFPQYDRADLLRELRSRGSSEGVVESVLQGAFTGVVRGQQEEEEAAAQQAGDQP